MTTGTVHVEFTDKTGSHSLVDDKGKTLTAKDVEHDESHRVDETSSTFGISQRTEK